MKALEWLGQGYFITAALAAAYALPREDGPAHEVPVVSRMLSHDPHEGPLRIVSWNVLRCYDWQSIERTLRRIFSENDPHVVFLQEWPWYDDEPFWETDAKELFDGWSIVYAPVHTPSKRTPYYPFRHTGNLIAVRIPIDGSTALALPNARGGEFRPGHEVRRVAVGIRAGGVGLYNFHLENCCTPAGRKRQVQAVMAMAKDDVAVIGGDANFYLGAWMERGIHAFADAGYANLFAGPEIRPYPRLDYFFVRGASGRGMQLKGEGSDHQPILAQITLS